ncbi:MAG: hypothetical protein CL878_06050 [Dehalococcoidia bacterium]|nr:hypothetical protein [Dehalococcoidia bacterium]
MQQPASADDDLETLKQFYEERMRARDRLTQAEAAVETAHNEFLWSIFWPRMVAARKRRDE